LEWDDSTPLQISYNPFSLFFCWFSFFFNSCVDQEYFCIKIEKITKKDKNFASLTAFEELENSA